MPKKKDVFGCLFVKGVTKVRKYRRAGITLEVSLVMPMFLMFVMMLFSVFDMMCLHIVMDSALQQVGQEMSVYSYVYHAYDTRFKESGKTDYLYGEGNMTLSSEQSQTYDFLKDMFLKEGYIKSRIVSLVGEERLENSMIVGGISGITLWRSDLEEDNQILDLTMTYRVRPWFSFSGIGEMVLMNRCYVHTYTGYVQETLEDGTETYYITENAEVYHTNRECTHLRLTIRSVSSEALSETRNLYGGKYTECEICYTEDKEEECLYIALQGDRYHSAISCSGLKRTVYTVSQKEISGLPLCSRCLQESK